MMFQFTTSRDARNSQGIASQEISSFKSVLLGLLPLIAVILLTPEVTQADEPWLKLRNATPVTERATLSGPPIFIRFVDDERYLFAFNDTAKIYDRAGTVLVKADLRQHYRPRIEYAQIYGDKVYLVIYYVIENSSAYVSPDAYLGTYTQRYVGIWDTSINEMIAGTYVDQGEMWNMKGLVVDDDGTIFAMSANTFDDTCLLYRLESDLSAFEKIFEIPTDTWGDYCIGLAQREGETGTAWMYGSLLHPSNLPATTTLGDPADTTAFAAEIDDSGTLQQVLQIGGANGDHATDIALLNDGGVAVLTTTWSDGLPTGGDVVQPNMPGTRNMYIARADAAGTFTASTYLGSSYLEAASLIEEDVAGNLHVFGTTYSLDYPTTDNAFLEIPAEHGGSELAIEGTYSVLNGSLTELKYSSYLAGTASNDVLASSIVLDTMDVRFPDADAVSLLVVTGADLFIGRETIPENFYNKIPYYHLDFSRTGPWIDQEAYLTPMVWDEPYSHQLAARGGTPPYTWRLRPEVLPPGISMNSQGSLQGTYYFESGTEVDRRLLVNIEITDADDATSMAAAHLPTVPYASFYDTSDSAPRNNIYELNESEYFEVIFAVSQGWGPFRWKIDGVLPPDIESHVTEFGDRLTLSGTPREPGSYSFTIHLEDSLGLEASERFTFSVMDQQTPSTGGNTSDANSGGGSTSIFLLILLVVTGYALKTFVPLSRTT